MQAYLFQGITEMTRQRILESAREESYAQRDFIFRQGESASHFFILINDLIGWSSLVENGTYTASAECLGPVKVLRIEKQRLDEILLQDPISGMTFFKNLAAIIGRRLVKSYQATLSVHGVREPRPGG
jgi:CRP-like cAMP-binding protein